MRTVLILLLVSLLFVTCGKDADKDSAIEKNQPASTTDNELLIAASNRLIGKFSSELKGELMSAMSNGGAENAIGVCQVKAPEIARANSGEYWSISRVTGRNRNPENLADKHQMTILNRFADTTGQMPEYSYEWPEQSPTVFRFYKPIMTAPLCLKCHGPVDQIDPAVKAALKEKYPEDRATGYNSGELRGMFVVEVKWPEGKAFAEQLATDSL